MPRYLPIQMDAANSDIKAVYSQVEDVCGTVPNLIKTLAHSPDLLKVVTDLFLALARGESALSEKIRQLVILKTCRLDKCKVTADAHKTQALKSGVSEEQLAALEAYAGNDLFDCYEQDALSLTEQVLSSPDNISGSQFWTQLDNHYTSDQIVEMVTLISAVNMINRIILVLEIEA